MGIAKKEPSSLENKILIFGRGYIGTEYLNSNLFEKVFLSDRDITRIDQIELEIEKYKPDAVINCAGKTNLEWCRDNKLGAIMSNIAGPLNLLNICKNKNIYLVHLGSGCIFKGDNNGKGFGEEDKPTPQCFYTYTKVVVDELLLKENYNKLLILRLRQPFSNKPNPRNLLTKLLSYEKLIISPNSMTYVPDLISATKFLLEKKLSGIFNIVNVGAISPYEIAIMANLILGLKKNFMPISKEEFDEMDKETGREKRVDTVLNCDKLEKTGLKMPEVTERLKESLEEYKK